LTTAPHRALDDRNLFINAAWVEPHVGGESTEVLSAADGTTLGHVASAGPADVDAAVEAASAAAAEWRVSTPEHRAAALRTLASALSSDKEELAMTISLEVGTPIRLSRRLQVGLPIAVLERYADDVVSVDFEARIGASTVLREPVGVVGAITPWNYPLHQAVAKMGAAIAAGCSIVVKPSDIAPLSLCRLADATVRAGFPPGLFNLVTGGAAAGEALVLHPGVDHVSFTGSTAVGTQVAAQAGARVIRCSLELGGKSASVVLDDAEIERAVRTSVGNALLNSGQTCTAWSRLVVPERLRTDVVDLVRDAAKKLPVGHPLDEDTKLGPLATAAQVQRVCRYVEIGRRQATLVFEGEVPDELPSNGNYVAPRAFADVLPESVLAQDEIFGPVLAILTYRDDEQAITIANGTRYGLAASVWSADPKRARRLARRLRAGQVDINGASFNPGAPFGGVRDSGFGRELGVHGITEFTEVKSIQEPGR
jgi:aldehyde dehydrogenase (NAD+)